MNVSRALKRLGISSDTFFTSGGRTGRLLEGLLQAEQVNVVPFYITAEARENFIVLDTTSNKQCRFGFPGELLTQDEQNEILNSVKVVNPLPDFGAKNS